MRLKRHRTKIFAQIPLGKTSAPWFGQTGTSGVFRHFFFLLFLTPTFFFLSFPFSSWLQDVVPHK